MQNSVPLCKTVWPFLKNLNLELWYDSAIPLSGIYPKKLKADIQTNTCTWVYMVALFTIAKRWKQPKYPSVDEWINNLWYIYNGILFGDKKEWSTDWCYNMDEPTKYDTWKKPNLKGPHILWLNG